ncbi:MAG TPA: class I SAM-dependent methyltransferase [Candidatus Paceibacterota bacterium]
MFSNPVKNLRIFGLKENDIVADLGAGTGFYSVAAGAMVPQGRVYAVEVEKDFLSTIKNKAKEAHLNNVECLWGDVEKIGGTKIGDSIVDAVIASSILFQVEDRERFIEEARRILKPGGRVLLIDWSDTEAVKIKNLIPKQKAREIFERKGFTYVRDVDAGVHHYGMIFTKN